MGGRIGGGAPLRAVALAVTLVVAVLAAPVQAQQSQPSQSTGRVVHQVGQVEVAAHARGKAKKPRPVVKKVKPAKGPTTGGTKVRIKGKNFTKVKKVTFGGTKARIVKVKNPRKIIVIAPKHKAGVVAVRVKTKAGRSKPARRARFTYVGATSPTQAPAVASLTPNVGSTAGGTSVAIKGANLAGATAVSFGGTPASSFAVQSATAIQAVAPAHSAGSVPVTVTTKGGTSTAVAFTYQAPSADPPVVVLVTPPIGSASGGTAATITGSGFIGATAVSFGGTAATAFTVDSDTSISATTPAHAPGIVDVSVTTAAGTSTVPGLFTYSPLPALPPVVALVAPLTGPTSGGTAVTITGTGLSGATAVSFDGIPATSFTVDSDLSISATTPAHAAGLVSVSVTTPAGTSTVPGLFTYTPLPALPPVVVLVAPIAGPTGGGTAVTITGTGFSGATSVSIGGTSVPSFTVTSDLSISAITPAHGLGLADVSVTTPAGTSTVPGLYLFF